MTYFYDIKATGEARSFSADSDEAAVEKVKLLEGDEHLVGISSIYTKISGETRLIWLE